MAPVVKSTSPDVRSIPQPRVLVVDDEPTLVELVSDVVRAMNCRILTAGTVAEARKILANQDVEVLVTDVHLPDGDGLSLLAALHRRRPSASAVVITGAPSVANAIVALREGAVDFVPKPFDNEQLIAHVKKALARQARALKHEQKLDRLRLAVKRLSEARRTISKKVDILCNDLVSAYGDLSKQLDSVRTQEGFRKAIDKSTDLEQLLCHAMDWMLRQLGYTNVGVWLAGAEGDYQLGAYMKYTTAGEHLLTEAMKRVVLPIAARGALDAPAKGIDEDDDAAEADGVCDGVVRLRGNDLIDQLEPDERPFFRGQDILAANCTYLGESLAAMVFFRDAATPFSADDEALLRAISPIFAVSLASIVREADGPSDDSASEDDAAPEADADADSRRDEAKDSDVQDRRDGAPRKRGGKPRKDPADWWKNGEPPPF